MATKSFLNKGWAVLLAVFFSVPLWAQDFSVGLGTELPLGLSLDAKIDVPQAHAFGRVRYGMVLQAYTDVMNSTAESFDFYNSATGEIISESLSQAQYWELAVGMSQSPQEGYFAEAAYISLAGEGEVTGATIVEAISGVTLPAGGNIYDIEGRVDSAVVRVGYSFKMQDRSTLALSFGIMKPLTSETQIDRDVTGPVQRALLDAANRELDEYMQETLENDVYIPLIGLSWLYSF